MTNCAAGRAPPIGPAAASGDGSGRFLPWIVALMVYLAALSLAGMMALHGMIERWDESLAGTLTVQLPPGDQSQLDAVLAVLRATPGVVSAKPLDDAANAALLEPWLGSGARRSPSCSCRASSTSAWTATRAAIAPRSPTPSRRRRRERGSTTTGAGSTGCSRPRFAVELVAAAIVVMVGAAAVLSIVFATRTSLAIHHGVVEVLHLIGARDGYHRRASSSGRRCASACAAGSSGSSLAGAHASRAAPGRRSGAGEALTAAVDALPSSRSTPLQWRVLLLLAPVAGLTALVDGAAHRAACPGDDAVTDRPAGDMAALAAPPASARRRAASACTAG